MLIKYYLTQPNRTEDVFVDAPHSVQFLVQLKGFALTCTDRVMHLSRVVRSNLDGTDDIIAHPKSLVRK